MGARIGFKKTIKRCIDVVFSAVFEQAVDDFGELGFPVAVFQFAAGIGKTGGQALEFSSIA